MQNKTTSFISEQKNNIILFLFSLCVFIVFFSFSNNFRKDPVHSSDLKDSVIQQQQRMEKIWKQEKLESLSSLQDKGCGEVMIDGKVCDMKVGGVCKKLVQASSYIQCTQWNIVHMKRPEVLKSIYYTSYSGVSSSKYQQLLDIVHDTEVNSVVIDIKEVDGKVAFDMSGYDFGSLQPESNHIIKNPEALIKKLHQEGVYVIGRIVVFKDKILAEKRPDLAIKKADKKTVWTDYKGKKYLDPNNKEVWDYVVDIARSMYLVGFDEINFDYIRFPSDGNMQDIYHPFSQESINLDPKWGRSKIMDTFFNYLSQELRSEFPEISLSGDLFGYTAIVKDDLKIGQIIESAILYFDTIAPMTYPSHYSKNFLGLGSADSHPYEVIYHTMEKVTEKIDALNLEIVSAKEEGRKIVLKEGFEAALDIQDAEVIGKEKMMIWLQGFSCVWCKPSYIQYGRKEVQDQSRAAKENGYDNWFIWNAASRYDKEWFLENK